MADKNVIYSYIGFILLSMYPVDITLRVFNLNSIIYWIVAIFLAAFIITMIYTKAKKPIEKLPNFVVLSYLLIIILDFIILFSVPVFVQISGSTSDLGTQSYIYIDYLYIGTAYIMSGYLVYIKDIGLFNSEKINFLSKTKTVLIEYVLIAILVSVMLIISRNHLLF
ncbi:MAG: hypothetical protein ABEK59_12465 [Halobacteria archaeon]